MHGGRFDVFDCCVGVGLPCRSIVRFSTIHLQAVRINKSSPLLPVIGRRGTVESVLTSCYKNQFRRPKLRLCVKSDRPWAARDDHRKNSTAIVRGKWPSNGRT
jgi:hypothetical protein